MENRLLVLGTIYLALLGFLIFISIRFRSKFWRIFATLFPFLMTGMFILNIILFPRINQPYFNWAYRGQLQRLPSNGLIDLYGTSGTPIKPRWIYTVVEVYYRGRTLKIPLDLPESLALDTALLVSQGQLAEVELIETDWELTPNDREELLKLNPGLIQTWKLDSKGNTTREEGDLYHFIPDDSDPPGAVMLLRYQDQLFFLPEDLRQRLEGGRE